MYAHKFVSQTTLHQHAHLLRSSQDQRYRLPVSLQRTAFHSFFGDTMLQYLVETTKKSPVTVDEMRGFIAVILNIGIIQLTNLKDYWSTDDTTDFPFFRSVFSRDCFFQIFGMLYVGDPDGSTRLDKIQPFIDRLCPVFESVFTPSQQIAIDESVIPSRDGCPSSVSEGKATPLGYESICAIRQQNRLPSEGVCVLWQGHPAH